MQKSAPITGPFLFLCVANVGINSYTFLYEATVAKSVKKQIPVGADIDGAWGGDLFHAAV